MDPGSINIEGYKILERLGEGGMGQVFKAEQLSMQRLVAIKVISKRKNKYVSRFLREARSAAKLNHTNIVGAIDVGTTDNLYYFVMEFIEGTTIEDIIEEKGPMSEKEALKIADAIAKALTHASKHKIIHRDIKPENIMLTNDNIVKLCDLGLAREVAEAITQTGEAVGTPHYMSPEQCQGMKNVDARSDIYSLGITLYKMVTGSVPFEAVHAAAICMMHITKPFPDPKFANPRLSQKMVKLIQKMTEKQRENRFQNPQELLDAVQAVQEGKNALVGVNKPKVKVTRPATRKYKRSNFSAGENRQRSTGENRQRKLTSTGRHKQQASSSALSANTKWIVGGVAMFLLALFALWPSPKPPNQNSKEVDQEYTQEVFSLVEKQEFKEALDKANEYIDKNPEDTKLTQWKNLLDRYFLTTSKIKKAAENKNYRKALALLDDYQNAQSAMHFAKKLKAMRKNIIDRDEKKYSVAQKQADKILKQIKEAIDKDDKVILDKTWQERDKFLALDHKYVPIKQNKWRKNLSESAISKKIIDWVIAKYRVETAEDWQKQVRDSLISLRNRYQDRFIVYKYLNESISKYKQDTSPAEKDPENPEERSEDEVDKKKQLQRKLTKALELHDESDKLKALKRSREVYELYEKIKAEYPKRHDVHKDIKELLAEVRETENELTKPLLKEIRQSTRNRDYGKFKDRYKQALKVYNETASLRKDRLGKQLRKSFSRLIDDTSKDISNAFFQNDTGKCMRLFREILQVTREIDRLLPEMDKFQKWQGVFNSIFNKVPKLGNQLLRKEKFYQVIDLHHEIIKLNKELKRFTPANNLEDIFTKIFTEVFAHIEKLDGEKRYHDSINLCRHALVRVFPDNSNYSEFEKRLKGSLEKAFVEVEDLYQNKKFDDATRICEAALASISEDHSQHPRFSELLEKMADAKSEFPDVKKFLKGRVPHFNVNDRRVEVFYEFNPSNAEELMLDWQPADIRRQKQFNFTKKNFRPFPFLTGKNTVLWKFPVKGDFDIRIDVLNPANKQVQKEIKKTLGRKIKWPKDFGIITYYNHRSANDSLLFLANMEANRPRKFNGIFRYGKRRKLLAKSNNRFSVHQGRTIRLEVKVIRNNAEFKVHNEYMKIGIEKERKISNEGHIGFWAPNGIIITKIEIRTHLDMKRFFIDRKLHLSK